MSNVNKYGRTPAQQKQWEKDITRQVGLSEEPEETVQKKKINPQISKINAQIAALKNIQIQPSSVVRKPKEPEFDKDGKKIVHETRKRDKYPTVKLNPMREFVRDVINELTDPGSKASNEPPAPLFYKFKDAMSVIKLQRANVLAKSEYAKEHKISSAQAEQDMERLGIFDKKVKEQLIRMSDKRFGNFIRFDHKAITLLIRCVNREIRYIGKIALDALHGIQKTRLGKPRIKKGKKGEDEVPLTSIYYRKTLKPQDINLAISMSKSMNKHARGAFVLSVRKPRKVLKKDQMDKQVARMQAGKKSAAQDHSGGESESEED